MTEHAVELKSVVKRYGDFTAVHDTNLDIPEGSFLTLLGPSGCGKTTTLRMIAGLTGITEGDILIKGRRVNDLPIHKRNLGIVFQNYALFPHRTVQQNVAFGLKYRNTPKDEAERRVREALELVQLPQMADRMPSQLSGGQQQRIALARAIVFEGSEDYHDRINDKSLNIDENCILFIRGTGPLGWPGSAEVVNMQPPDDLIKAGVDELPVAGDGRQSGTSGSPSILHISPESAVGGGLALLQTGDMIRLDLNTRTLDIQIDDAEMERRRKNYVQQELQSQTPWQEMFRSMTGQLENGMVLENAVKYQRISQTRGLPRDNH